MKRTSLAFSSLLLAIAVGCGGDDHADGTTGASTAAPVFITDAPNPNWDAVWVTIREVSVHREGRLVAAALLGSGRPIVRNLADLHDPTGSVLSYLGDLGVEVKPGDGIHIEFDENVQVHIKGGSDDQPTKCKLIGAVDGKKGYDHYAARKGITEKGIKIACDLSKWTLDGTALTAPNGTVGGLDGPVSIEHPRDAASGLATGKRTYTGGRFALELDGLTVVGTPETQVYYADGDTSPTLTNGQRLTATGRYSDGENAFVADTIRIESPDATDSVSGTVAAIEGDALKVKPKSQSTPTARLFVRFQPDQRTIPVVNGTKTDTKGFLAGLKVGDTVDGIGGYDEKTGTLSLRTVRRSNPGQAPFSAHFRIKTKSNIKNDFVIAPISWLGFDSSSAASLSLTSSGETTYVIGGESLSQAQFLEGIGPNDEVVATFKTKPKTKPTVSVHYDLKSCTKL